MLPYLSPRQWSIVDLLTEGYTNQQIGAILHLNTEVVKNHVRPLYDLTGMGSRLELALWNLSHRQEITTALKKGDQSP